ncbi:photosystem I reaction center subunit IX [Prochlorococcus marinus]|uniref:Photosystem I reaction center subunit IX n=1 Tax=Prochlorococcus marinus (strain MIT 9211) TaxID=93059 RepID=PSAJ_PROM4|nr:photosystem I reaction center subunit IX [Prochlorococcus marinus]A9BE89.1 RecName: Full=Photosystem I reaction center subunit IX [Prochlorococcus marinus str. MIT 9211]ABX08399.1 Photosystem I PsaJ protein (subunit IX) [Prochlorococcus marinus str. MIT 9211]
MFKLFSTKWFRSAPVVATIWIVLTAGILVEWNRFVPDLLFHPGL